MSLPERIQFNFILPDRPGSLESYPNLSERCNQIIDNMEEFHRDLRRLREDLEPDQWLAIIDDLSVTVHEAMQLSLNLQQHLGLLTDSDEEIHLQESVINYVRAVINNASRMDDIVLAAQEALHSTRRHHR